MASAEREFLRRTDPTEAARCVWMQCLMGDAWHPAALAVFDAMRQSERDDVVHLLALKACAKQTLLSLL